MSRTATATAGPASERRTSTRVSARSEPKATATKKEEVANKAPTKTSGKKRSASTKQEDKINGAVKKTKTSEDAEKGVQKGASSGQLTVGDSLPELTLPDEAGENVEIGKLKKVVIFMYPKANTGGCTSQAQAYRDEYSAWKEIGYDVYGLSSDNLTPLKNWKEKHNFEYKLLSDPQRSLIGLLTGTKSKTIRSHVVVDSHGKVAEIKLNVPPKESCRLALAVARKAA